MDQEKTTDELVSKAISDVYGVLARLSSWDRKRVLWRVMGMLGITKNEL